MLKDTHTVRSGYRTHDLANLLKITTYKALVQQCCTKEFAEEKRNNLPEVTKISIMMWRRPRGTNKMFIQKLNLNFRRIRHSCRKDSHSNVIVSAGSEIKMFTRAWNDQYVQVHTLSALVFLSIHVFKRYIQFRVESHLSIPKLTICITASGY